MIERVPEIQPLEAFHQEVAPDWLTPVYEIPQGLHGAPALVLSGVSSHEAPTFQTIRGATFRPPLCQIAGGLPKIAEAMLLAAIQSGNLRSLSLDEAQTHLRDLGLTPSGLVTLFDPTQGQYFKALVPEPEYFGVHCIQGGLHGLGVLNTQHICRIVGTLPVTPVKTRYQRLKEA